MPIIRNINLIVAMMLVVLKLGIAQTAILYTYDDLNRLTRVNYPDGSYITYTYDLLGNRIGYEVNPCVNFVANTNDDGTGSLRRAVDCAEVGDTIFFHNDLISGTIQLTSAKITIDKNLVFVQEQNEKVNIESTFSGSVFLIENGVTVHMEYINLYGGQNSEGRAIENNGNLTLKNVDIFDDLINSGSGSTIVNNGTLNIEGNCNIKDD